MTTTETTYHSAGELIADAIRPIAQSYRETVNDIAKEALELADEEERETFVWESVDGSEWVIYYQNARAVAMVTDNLEAYEDGGIDLGSLPDGASIETLIAFYAMRADVCEAIERLPAA